MKRHPLQLLLALIVLINLLPACDFLRRDQTGKANDLIAEANAAINAGNVSALAASKKNDWIFQEIQDTTFADDKVRLKAAATETINGFNQSAAKFREAARKFEEASRLRINGKFKEYLLLKSQEFDRNAEKMETVAAIPQAVLDSDTIEILKQRFDDNKTRYEELEKEAKELADRADKVRAENKDQFPTDNANK